MEKNESFKKKFFLFIAVSFGSILISSMIIVSFMLNASFEEQTEKYVHSQLNSIAEKISDKMDSIMKVLGDHSNQSTIINPLMQYEVNNLSLIDYLSNLSIVGYKGKFSVLTFDEKYLVGQNKYELKDFNSILTGESNGLINIIDPNLNEFQFMVPIKFSGNIEGVFIFNTIIPSGNLINTSEITSNLFLSQGLDEISLISTPMDTDLPVKDHIFMDYGMKLTNIHDPYVYIREKIKSLLSIFMVLTIFTFFFFSIFYNKGKQYFVAPHEELLRVRRELDNSVSFKDLLINSSSHLIISTDINGTILTFNKMAEEELGYSAAEVIGKVTPSLFHKLDEVVTKTNEYNKKFNINLTPGFQTFTYVVDNEKEFDEQEWQYVRKDGSEFSGRLLISGIESNLGHLIGYLGVIEDITALNLAKEVEFMAKKDLEKTTRMKSEFLANMSHEIRTPMNGVLGMVQLLSDTQLDENQLDMLSTIRSSGDILLKVLNDILDLSKIESGKLDLEMKNFDFNKCVSEAICLSEFSAKLKNIDIKYTYSGENMFFIGDVTRMQQVITNYLSNAVKFTEKGSITVDVQVSDSIEGYSNIVVKVIDTGIGISSEGLEKLFKSFSQTDTSTTRKYGGTGLGLSICSKLMEIMDGEVFVESTLGAGSTFGARLKLQNGSQAKDMNNHENNSQVINLNPVNIANDFPHKILVVEDNKVNQKIVLMLLRNLGYSIDIVENGLEAINKIKEVDFDYSIVFMDMQMPIMGGVEATEHIVRTYGEDFTRIIAMTANAFSEDKQACFKAGMVDYISKPVQKAELIRVLTTPSQKNQIKKLI
jgi:PAS domain S-box-containing protein